MKILVMAGHTASGNTGSGAVGYINESNETRKVGPKVVEYLKQLGVDATYIKLDKATTSSYLYDQVKLANSKGTFDCVVQIHFNAGSSDPNENTTGTETYYVSSKGKVFADRVNAKLSTLFRNRGSRSDKPNLYWLKNTTSPAILIETCFVDDKDDVKVYQENFDTVCKLIAEGLSNKFLQPNKETKYRIVTGSFGTKEKAEENLKHLQSLTNLYSWVELEYGKTDSYRIAIGAFIGEDNTIKYMEALKLLTNWWMTYELM